jgi:hypothetical protein
MWHTAIGRTVAAAVLAAALCGCSESGDGGPLTTPQATGGPITGARLTGACPPTSENVGDGFLFGSKITNTSGRRWPQTYVDFIGQGFTVDNWQEGTGTDQGQQTLDPVLEPFDVTHRLCGDGADNG